jgi:hypothetical protein
MGSEEEITRPILEIKIELGGDVTVGIDNMTVRKIDDLQSNLNEITDDLPQLKISMHIYLCLPYDRSKFF